MWTELVHSIPVYGQIEVLCAVLYALLVKYGSDM